MFKKYIIGSLLLALLGVSSYCSAFTSDVNKGITFYEWCKYNNSGAIYHTNMHIENISTMMKSKLELVDVIATLKIIHTTDNNISEHYNLLISPQHYFIYDLAKTAYLSGMNIKGCIKKTQNQNFLIGIYTE